LRARESCLQLGDISEVIFRVEYEFGFRIPPSHQYSRIF